jgi:Kef-type K+ transport system membrane component KefB
MAGNAAGPEGQLFRIGVLGIAAHLAGAILQPLGVPPLVGMLVMGIVLRNTRSVELTGPYKILAADVRYRTLSASRGTGPFGTDF